MTSVIYCGDHASVFVPLSATETLNAEWGKPISVSDNVAERLIESGAWMLAADQSPKKKKTDKPDVIPTPATSEGA